MIFLLNFNSTIKIDYLLVSTLQYLFMVYFSIHIMLNQNDIISSDLVSDEAITSDNDVIESIDESDPINQINQIEKMLTLNLDYISKTPYRTWVQDVKHKSGYEPCNYIVDSSIRTDNSYEYAPEEKKKCRYDDDFLKKHSMVTIDQTGKTVDFVDASYIGDSFISASAPINCNYGNWWKLIYDKVSLIVMVTPYVESGRTKADKYIPLEENKFTVYGDYLVKIDTIESDEQNGISVSKLTIRKTDNDNNDFFKFPVKIDELINGSIENTNTNDRTVCFIHYTHWTDNHIPDYNEFKKLIIVYEKYQILSFHTEKQNLKPLVHCSAGIGRTGTFIAIQYLINEIKTKIIMNNNSSSNTELNTELNIDFNIVKTINKMRTCRSGMVQTNTQVQFIYNYIRDAIINNEIQS